MKLGTISASEAKQILKRYERDENYLRLDLAPKKSELTVRELCALYLQDITSIKEDSTVKTETWILNYFCKTYGDLKIHELTAEEVERHFKKKRYKAYSAYNIAKSLRGAYKLGCLRKFIDVNPIIKIRLPKLDKIIPRYSDRKTIDLVLNKMPVRIRSYYEILRYAGVRPGEALRLQARDVVKNALIIRATKTKNFRAVPIHPKLRPFLKTLLQDKDPEDFLFPGKNGGHQKSMKMGIRRAIVALGKEKIKVKLSPNMFRHTFATQVLRKSNLRAVQTLLGHARSTTTERYAHALADDLQKAVFSL